MDYEDFQVKLTGMVDDDFRAFAVKGVLTEYPFLGVRTPDLRKLAREILKNGDSEKFIRREPKSYEELTMQGLVIAGLPYEEIKREIVPFSRRVDNWATADTFCNSLKVVRKHREDFLPVVDELIREGTEFSIRIGLVCLLGQYMTFDYLAVIFDRVMAVKDREEYYIKMAVAWLMAECFTKYPDETWGVLKAGALPKWTQNKTISKIRDSYRVPEEVKEALKGLRK